MYVLLYYGSLDFYEYMISLFELELCVRLSICRNFGV